LIILLFLTFLLSDSGLSITDFSNLNTRMRLILAAADCFADKGFEGTSTRDIANKADVAQQLITYHFGTKEELWIATVNYLQESFIETSQKQQFDESKDLIAQFRQHWINLMTERMKNPQMQRIMYHEFLSDSDRHKEHIIPLMDKFYAEIVEPYFQKVVNLGITSNFEPWQIGLICSGVLHLNVINPSTVTQFLELDPKDSAAITKQVDLIVRLLTQKDEIVLNKISSEECSDATYQQRIQELEDIVIELTLENKKLKNLLN
jgi:AcrR family transcriptional regulator